MRAPSPSLERILSAGRHQGRVSASCGRWERGACGCTAGRGKDEGGGPFELPPGRAAATPRVTHSGRTRGSRPARTPGGPPARAVSRPSVPPPLMKRQPRRCVANVRQRAKSAATARHALCRPPCAAARPGACDASSRALPLPETKEQASQLAVRALEPPAPAIRAVSPRTAWRDAAARAVKGRGARSTPGASSRWRFLLPPSASSLSCGPRSSIAAAVVNSEESCSIFS